MYSSSVTYVAESKGIPHGKRFTSFPSILYSNFGLVWFTAVDTFCKRVSSHRLPSLLEYLHFLQNKSGGRLLEVRLPFAF